MAARLPMQRGGLDLPETDANLGGALRGFFILSLKLLIFSILVVYGIWEDWGAWKILLRGVPMICLQF